MTPDEFRRLALETGDAVERAHMNQPDFRVGGKIFATLDLNHRQGIVKLTPEQQERVMREHPSVFQAVAGQPGRQGSTLIKLATATADQVAEALRLARENLEREARHDSSVRRAKARTRSR